MNVKDDPGTSELGGGKDVKDEEAIGKATVTKILVIKRSWLLLRTFFKVL